jgi:hypothetical protein
LHEIGHFKIKKGHGYKMPAEYKKVERLLRKEHPGDTEAQLYAVKDYIPKRPKETSRQWFARIESFKAYLLGDAFEDHGYVEDWARAELKRKRKEIASLL